MGDKREVRPRIDTTIGMDFGISFCVGKGMRTGIISMHMSMDVFDVERAS